MTNINDKTDGGTWARDVTDISRATESLEAELRELSDRISADPLRFQWIREELKRRRRVKDEQPMQETDEQRVAKQQEADRNLSTVLALQITAMEAEQAKLVLEVEVAKAARREAEERLALVTKWSTTKREPLSRQTARELINRFKANDNLNRAPFEWVIDVIVEASK